MPIICWTNFQSTFIHGPNIPGFYVILLFTTTDVTSITCHIHNGALFSPCLCLIVLSGVISPLFSDSILGSYWPGEFIFQCHIFLHFHTAQGKNTKVVCHSLLQWTTFCQNSSPWCVHLGWPYTELLSFIELDKAVVHVISLISFMWLWFSFCLPLTIKDGNDIELTEAESIKNRWQEYTELYKKDLHDPENHDAVITYLEPDILKCRVKWTLGSIIMNKASGDDGIPVELSQF